MQKSKRLKGMLRFPAFPALMMNTFSQGEGHYLKSSLALLLLVQEHG